MAKPSRAPAALPATVEDALARALRPVTPPPERVTALRARILQRAREGGARFVTVRAADGTWVPLLPKVALKMLDDDGEMQSFLLRLDPGGCLPAHDHHADEVCVVLEGTVRLGEVEVSAGDYHVALAGSCHGEVSSADGAVLFIRTRSGFIPHRPTR